jgi:hypothetical protein
MPWGASSSAATALISTRPNRHSRPDGNNLVLANVESSMEFLARKSLYTEAYNELHGNFKRSEVSAGRTRREFRLSAIA